MWSHNEYGYIHFPLYQESLLFLQDYRITSPELFTQEQTNDTFIKDFGINIHQLFINYHCPQKKEMNIKINRHLFLCNSNQIL